MFLFYFFCIFYNIFHCFIHYLFLIFLFYLTTHFFYNLFLPFYKLFLYISVFLSFLFLQFLTCLTANNLKILIIISSYFLYNTLFIFSYYLITHFIPLIKFFIINISLTFLLNISINNFNIFLFKF